MAATVSLSGILSEHQSQILDQWIAAQKTAGVRTSPGRESEFRSQSSEFLKSFIAIIDDDRASIGGPSTGGASPEWNNVKDFLENLSRTRAKQGFSPSETAVFIFSLKDPVFHVLQGQLGNDGNRLVQATVRINSLLDQLGLYTIEIFQKTREEVIARQQQELMELSTPVVRLWDEVLALPLIGTLDSARTQVVMESLLQEIVSTGASIAIIDITGVPTVDTLVAQHLLKTIAAARLMGADCIISGIRPQIAQTIVHLGVELNDVITKATLADAFALALARTGKTVVSKKDLRNLQSINAQNSGSSMNQRTY
jgi:rsbT co-antagonist protein RsbR